VTCHYYHHTPLRLTCVHVATGEGKLPMTVLRDDDDDDDDDNNNNNNDEKMLMYSIT